MMPLAPQLLVSDASAAAVSGAGARVRVITLHSYTSLHLAVVPGLGVRLAFPKVSRGNGSPAQLAIVLTDRALFEVGEPQSSGRMVVVTAAPGARPGTTADLFMTLGPYRVTVMLRLARPGPADVTDVLFHLPPRDRARGPGKACRKPARDSGQRLGAVAAYCAATSITRRIREQGRHITASGIGLVLRVKDQITRGPYRVIRFSVRDRAQKKIEIEQVSVGIEQEHVSVPVRSAWAALRSSVSPEARAVVAVFAHVLPRSRYIELEVETNLGQVTARW